MTNLTRHSTISRIFNKLYVYVFIYLFDALATRVDKNSTSKNFNKLISY